MGKQGDWLCTKVGWPHRTNVSVGEGQWDHSSSGSIMLSGASKQLKHMERVAASLGGVGKACGQLERARPSSKHSNSRSFKTLLAKQNAAVFADNLPSGPVCDL